MTHSKTIKRHDDHRENARAIRDYLDASTIRDGLFEDPLIEAMYCDVSGLLAAISRGTIKTGQPRVVERLIQIVQNYPEGKNPNAIIEAIAACSECGLSAEGHAFPGIYRAQSTPER
jgi:hypothetical protein